MYKLTIAVLTYNRANYLKIMLDSIMQQTFKEFIIIIYDNCSEDNTSEIVKPYLDDNRFSYHKHAVIINNFNYALQNCKTDYLLIVHDDDYMHPDMVKEEITILDANKEFSIVWTNMNHVDINGQIIRPSFLSRRMNNQDCVINSREYIEVLIKKDNIVVCPAVMFRMSIMKTYNLCFRENVGKAADLYLWLELSQLNYKFYYINNALYNYRIHDGQDSRQTLLLNPLLKKPVYSMLLENNYSKDIIKSWLKWVNYKILFAIDKGQNKKHSFNMIKNHIFLKNEREYTFRVLLFCLLYVPSFISIKKIIPNPIKRLIRSAV